MNSIITETIGPVDVNRKEEVQRVCADLPTFSNCARRIGVSTTTLTFWRRTHPEFDSAYIEAKELQKEFLIQNALAGLYPAQAFIFVAKNITDMADRTELTAKAPASDPAAVAKQPSLEHVPVAQLERALELMDQAQLLLEARLPETIRKEK